MESEPPSLAGRRVLVVEDDMLLLMCLSDTLSDLGCHVAGSASTVAQALRVAESAPLDLAILDVNVAGETVYPVADVLSRRGIPYMFLTGYEPHSVNSRYRDRPLRRKPIDVPDLAQVLSGLLNDKTG